MLFLIDQDVPQSIATWLADRTHDVRHVRIELEPEAPDHLIARHASQIGAVVITFNHKLKRLIQRAPDGNHQRHRNAGRISFRCHQLKGQKRLEKVFELIEKNENADDAPDKRLLVEITAESICIIR